MSGKQDNKRELDREEMGMVNGGVQPEKEALPDPFGTDPVNQTDPIDPLNKWTPSGISLKQRVDKQAQRKVQQTSHLAEGEKRVRGIKLKQGSPERL